MTGRATSSRNSGGLASAIVLAGAIAVAAPAQADIWDFVADSRRAAEDHARDASATSDAARDWPQARPVGAPRTVLPTRLWEQFVAAAAPATTSLAALATKPVALAAPELGEPADDRQAPETAAAAPARPQPAPAKGAPAKHQTVEHEAVAASAAKPAADAPSADKPSSVRPSRAASPADARPTPPAIAAMPTATPHPETSTRADACGADAIGPSRSVAVDTAGGPHFGRHDRFGAPTFLGPKEVVLTFDDGPRPKTTRRILKTLEEHCVKATFFVVGRAAQWQPEILRETAAAGHTIAAHSATHPIPFNRQGHRISMREIDRGFAMIEDALGAPIAPFFRFPGLAYSRTMLEELSARDVSAFSVDVISDDTASDATPTLIVNRTMTRLNRYGNGILLFHDTLNRTAAALPMLLDRLKAEGYRVVHLRSVRPYRAPASPPAGGSALVASAPAETRSDTPARKPAVTTVASAPPVSSRAATPSRAPLSVQPARARSDAPQRRTAQAFRRPAPVSLEAPSIAAIY